MVEAEITDTLDGVTFRDAGPDRERALQDDVLLGELELYEIHNIWRARAFANGDFDAWQPMRCKAEARAFLVGLRKR